MVLYVSNKKKIQIIKEDILKNHLYYWHLYLLLSSFRNWQNLWSLNYTILKIKIYRNNWTSCIGNHRGGLNLNLLVIWCYLFLTISLMLWFPIISLIVGLDLSRLRTFLAAIGRISHRLLRKELWEKCSCNLEGSRKSDWLIFLDKKNNFGPYGKVSSSTNLFL